MIRGESMWVKRVDKPIELNWRTRPQILKEIKACDGMNTIDAPINVMNIHTHLSSIGCERRPQLGHEEGTKLATDDDLALVEQCVAGDQRAFQTLVERHQRRVFTIAFGVLRNRDDAMDVVQDAFVKVYRHLGSFQGKSRFTTWLYRIVMNLCIDKKRRKSREAQVAYDDALAHQVNNAMPQPSLASIHIDGPDRAYDRRELRQHMERTLDKLSADHREILVLREVEGLSYDDLSDTLEIPRGTVMSRLFHARKRFQQVFREVIA
jgi:RNA polymerase sigma-70 factor (ECF subfamily)